MVEWWWLLVVGFSVLILGMIAGFFIAKKIFLDELKKNPPVNAGMIRAMYGKMGRKPSELQVRSVINAMKKYQN